VSLIPLSLNDRYSGSNASVVYLAVLAVLTLIPGLIHSFLPDGGAVVIAHLDLGDRAQLVRGVFAWEGATQLALGAAMAMVAWRCRPLTPFFLLLVLLERGLMALDGWVLTPPTNGHHPPEHYASVAILPVTLVFLVMSLRARGGAGGAAATLH